MQSPNRGCARPRRRPALGLARGGGHSSFDLAPAMKNTVFIHTNEKQILGALVGRYALRRNSAAPERFDVRILLAEEFEFLRAREGQKYLREGKMQE